MSMHTAPLWAFTLSLVSVVACSGSSVSLGNDGGGQGGSANAGSAGAIPNGGSAPTAGASAGGVSSGGSTTGGSTNQGGSGSNAGSTSTAGAAGGGPIHECVAPVTGDGGWQTCKSGLTHRTTPATCTYKPRAAKLPASTGTDKCFQDSDCTAKPNGYCSLQGNFDGITGNDCSYGCLVDADCAADQLCQCGGVVAGSCVSSTNCKSDSDCAGGVLCSLYDANPGCYTPEYACQTPQDECETDSDCPSSLLPICGFDSTAKRRVCRAVSCQY